MSKELEALEKFLDDYLTLCEKLHTNRQEKMLLDKNSPYNVLKTYLQSIKKDNPSEALEKLEMLSDCAEAMKEAPSSNWIEYANNETELDYKLFRAYEDLKSVLLNAEKEHKALEIIKENKVNVGTFIHLTKILKKDYEQCKANNDIVFCNICDTEKEFLTEEEFNLLKEVLE